MPLTAKLSFKKLHPDAIIPKYAHPGDSGFDIYAVEDTIVVHGEITPVKTGLAAKVECTGYDGHQHDYMKQLVADLFTYEIQARPKSGLSMNEGITIQNTPGTIDSGYRGELIVLLTRDKTGSYRVKKGSKVAQCVICPVIAAPNVDIVEVQELDDTTRGVDGFGSTGVN